ncbi:MAG: hypothetical protein H6817_06025 [Phycisphaerales bacterium]|nr:hypothetical protein [Phycisphaerales bacterium]
MDDTSIPSKHYFSLKGKNAEDFLHELAFKTFLTDWCFPNPEYSPGKELCDLLVVFDRTAIIWQAKDLKLNKRGELRNSAVQKNIRQLSGARRRMLDIDRPITISNPRRTPEVIDPKQIEEVFLVSVLLGDTPDIQAFMDEAKGHQCHVFTREFAEIVLNELDTVGDFCDYLREKEKLFRNCEGMTILGGEEDLLATYLFKQRSLAMFQGYSDVVIEGGAWDDLRQREEYALKKKADEVSYLWDFLIGRAHEANVPEYEIIARELARPRRFNRRVLATAAYDAHVIAHHKDEPTGMYRRFLKDGETAFCFLFAGDGVPQDQRREFLLQMCEVARLHFDPVPKVVGIATAMRIEREASFDYAFVHLQELTSDIRDNLKKLQVDTGILTTAKPLHISHDEYPIADG